MARYKPYDYDQMMMVPICLADQLEPGTLEFAIHHIIEERIDTSFFDERYSNDDTGSRAIDPKVLLKIILFGYSRGIKSSRPLERACKENVMFMALTCGQTPDHSTIAAFISSMSEQVKPLFSQVLMICAEENLLGGSHFSIDGLKLSSNASKEYSAKFEDLEKKKKCIERKVKEVVSEHKKLDQRSEKKVNRHDKNQRDKRVKRLQRKVDKIEKFLKENEPKIGTTGKEIQSNVTDNESAKLKTSHGIVQGYNANAMVDENHQIIVHAEAFGNCSDGSNIRPMLEGAKENLQEIGHDEDVLKGKIVTADTSYYSRENLIACKDEEVDGYIPDQHFRKRDVKLKDAGRFRKPTDKYHMEYKKKDKKYFTVDDFHVNDETGQLICPAGNHLYRVSKNSSTSLKGYISSTYKAPKRFCIDCPLRSKCIKKPTTPARQVRIIHERLPGNITDQMKDKIDTPGGRKIYAKRLAIVEPVFGNIRAQKGMDRFTLATRSKVQIQWMLYCIVHNMEKVAHFGKSYAMGV